MASSLKYSKDDYVLDIRAALTNSTVRRPPTRLVLHTKFQPGAYQTLFEGSVTDEDTLQFAPFNQRYFIEQHADRKLHVPCLVEAKMDSSDPLQRIRFKDLFNQQLKRLQETHQEEDHGTLRVYGCFGNIYTFDELPQPQMTIADLHRWSEKSSNIKPREKRFRTSFISSEFPQKNVEKYLQEQGYELYNTKKFHKVPTMHVGNDATYNCHIILDENGKFIEYLYPPVKWATFSMKRADNALSDIRLVVESVRSVTEESDPAVRKYKGQDIIRVREDGHVVLRPGHISQDQSVTKVHEKYYRKPRDSTDGLNAEVVLHKFLRFIRPNLYGRFTRFIGWVVIIEIHALSWEYENFTDDFLNLCCELGKAK